MLESLFFPNLLRTPAGSDPLDTFVSDQRWVGGGTLQYPFRPGFFCARNLQPHQKAKDPTSVNVCGVLLYEQVLLD